MFPFLQQRLDFCIKTSMNSNISMYKRYSSSRQGTSNQTSNYIFSVFRRASSCRSAAAAIAGYKPVHHGELHVAYHQLHTSTPASVASCLFTYALRASGELRASHSNQDTVTTLAHCLAKNKSRSSVLGLGRPRHQGVSRGGRVGVVVVV